MKGEYPKSWTSFCPRGVTCGEKGCVWTSLCPISKKTRISKRKLNQLTKQRDKNQQKPTVKKVDLVRQAIEEFMRRSFP